MSETNGKLAATKGRPKGGSKLDPLLVAAALGELSGNVMAVAKRFSVQRNAIQSMIRKSATLQQMVLDCREGMKDHAESSLHRAIIAGEAWAVCFYLKTQAKDRGYIEKQELDLTTSGALALEWVTKHDREPAPQTTPNPAAQDPA